MTMAFDTHQAVKALKAAGFNDAQAEAMTTVVKQSQAAENAEMATKADLKLALSETKSDILKWMFGTIAVQTLAIIGAVAALARIG